MNRPIKNKDVDVGTVKYVLEAISRMPYINGNLERFEVISYLKELLKRMKYKNYKK